MKKYTIEIHTYPQEFIISAESEAEAKMKAASRFYDAREGKSIYEINVIEAEEL